jgi:lysophospholipase L1-like esterase
VQDVHPTAPLRFVALGDSYTIGTSVGPAERWPDQLVRRVSELRLVANLGVNGYASADVLRDEIPAVRRLAPEFVSLLVSVNDVVRGVPPDAYRRTTAAVLDELLALLPSSRMVAVSTPDYTVTPQGAAFGRPDRQRAGIVENNAILASLAADRKIAFVEIFDLSERAASDRSLVARDGLHPSGAQYALWVDRIEPVVRGLLALAPPV